METYISAFPNLSTRPNWHCFMSPSTKQRRFYFTFAGFAPFIIFVAAAGRTGAAPGATARP